MKPLAPRAPAPDSRGTRVPLAALGTLVPHAALAALVAIGAPGCAPSEDARAFETTDSAGVRIATNRASDAPEWRLGPEPRLDLGRVEGGGPEEFHGVVGGRILADGRIAVVNAGTAEVRVFGPDGAHLTTFGGEGDGPGEFRLPHLLWQIRGDSLVVWDGRLRRFAVFSADGTFGRSVALDHPMANPLALVVFDDGRSIVRSDEFDLSGGGFRQMYSSYYRFEVDGALLDTLPRQPFAVMGPLGDGGMIGGPLFGTRTETAGSEEGYWVGLGREEEVRRYRRDGTLAALVRWPPEDRTVRPEDVDRYVAGVLQRASEEDRPRRRRLLEDRPAAERFPSHALLIEDGAGRLWVQDYRLPGGEGSSRWSVFGPDGRLVGRITLPADHRILDVGRERLLTVGSGELGVEHVRLWELRGPGGSR